MCSVLKVGKGLEGGRRVRGGNGKMNPEREVAQIHRGKADRARLRKAEWAGARVTAFWLNEARGSRAEADVRIATGELSKSRQGECHFEG